MEGGLIYKSSPRLSRRVGSLLLLGAFSLLPLAVVFWPGLLALASATRKPQERQLKAGARGLVAGPRFDIQSRVTTQR
jgi:hypothetical protein